MNAGKPVFVADSCVGGLSVVKSLWDSQRAGNTTFLADYAVNPLGVKSDSEIADVVDRWLTQAAKNAETLIIACNTLSVRYHQLRQDAKAPSGLRQVVSMVDCLEAMADAESEKLQGQNVLIIGTAFTASQSLYAAILRDAVPGVRVSTVPATALERAIARFELQSLVGESILTAELRAALEKTDVAILACTCFPMVQTELEIQFPDVSFLDPGAWCMDLLGDTGVQKNKRLCLKVSGNVVLPERVAEFATSYLPDGTIVS